MPPTWFDLSIVPVAQAMRDIKNVTANSKDVENNYTKSMLNNMKREDALKKYKTFGYIPAPPGSMNNNEEIIKQIIGKDGCYFKKTTENCNIDFIYYNQKEELFMFWGQSVYTVTNAMKIIRSRICRTIAKHLSKRIENKQYLRYDEDMEITPENEPIDPNETREKVVYELYEKNEEAVDSNELFNRLISLSLDRDRDTIQN